MFGKNNSPKVNQEDFPNDFASLLIRVRLINISNNAAIIFIVFPIFVSVPMIFTNIDAPNEIRISN